MLTQSELNKLRSTYSSFFSSSLVIKRPTFASDGAGGFTNASSVVGTYGCHIRPDMRSNNSGNELLGKSVYLPQSYIITLDYTADVQKGDILSCTEGELAVVEIQEDGSFNLASRVVATVKDG